ncbi:hypothetical protein E4T50_10046 [Aureobasidium sp. EXF-12298]|nr:hypothetical protein E4T50_10046 [Aureobasidium sp. EXF-12298]
MTAQIRSYDKCKICQKIDTKLRRRAAEEVKIERWYEDGASIERSREIIKDLDQEIYQLQIEQQREIQTTRKIR